MPESKTELPLDTARIPQAAREVRVTEDVQNRPIYVGDLCDEIERLRGMLQSEGAGIAQKIIAMRERYQRERVDRDWTDWYDGGIETCNRILTMLDDSRTEQAERDA